MLDHVAHPVALISISDEFLAEREVRRIWFAVKQSIPEIVRQDIDASSESAAAELVAACSPSLFGDLTFIVVDNIEQSDEAMQKAVLGLISDDENQVNVLLIVRGGVKGRGFVDKIKKSKAETISQEVPKGRGIDEFILAEFKSHKRKAPNADAIKGLRDAVGDDLRGLAAAVSQLAADVEVEPITLAAVEQYYEGMAAVAPYVVTDAAMNGDATETLAALRWALERDPSIGPAIVATALNGVRGLVAVAAAPSGAGDGEIAAAAGVPPWKVRSLKAQVRSWPARRLADAMLALTQADAALKGGQIDGLGRVEVLDPVQRQALLERTLLKLAKP